MKRMYLTLGIIFLFIFWAGAILGQNSKSNLSPEEQMMQRLQKRSEMHRKILENFFNDFSADHDQMFEDMERLMDGALGSSFSGIATQPFKSEWQQSSDGRTLVITPQSPEQKLDIEVKEGMVSIKGMAEQKSAQGSSYSQFSNQFSVPSDCDATKVKMEQAEGKILLKFPFHSQGEVRREKSDRKPLPRSKSDVTI